MSNETERSEIARNMFKAFAAADRDYVEEHFAGDFTFHSPPDPELDRDGYFERCWPGAGTVGEFEFKRVIESGDEVIVTYEATGSGGKRSRNTEVLTFDGTKIRKVEVYFGWDLE